MSDNQRRLATAEENHEIDVAMRIYEAADFETADPDHTIFYLWVMLTRDLASDGWTADRLCQYVRHHAKDFE